MERQTRDVELFRPWRAVGLLAVFFFAILACGGTDQVADAVPFTVQRLDPQVLTGASSDSMAPLASSNPQSLPEGHRVSTDGAGQALLIGQSPNNQACQIYLFQLTSLTTKACSKFNYQGGNTATCQEENTAVYKECKGNLQMTPSAEAELVGRWVSLTYLPDRQLTLVIVGEGVAEVHPVTEFDTRALGDPIRVEAQQFLYTAPDAVLEEIAGLPPREPLPLEQLPLLVGAIGIEPWIERVIGRAQQDGVPWPVESDQRPTPTPSPAPSATVPSPTATPEPSPSVQVSCEVKVPTGWKSYVVGRDETLQALAWRYWTTPAELIRVNCLGSEILREGQFLYVPDVNPRPVCSQPAGWVVYTVHRGDTLFRLAILTGTTVAELMRANCLVGDTIYAGTTLWVPRLSPMPTRMPTFPPMPTATPTGTEPVPPGPTPDTSTPNVPTASGKPPLILTNTPLPPTVTDEPSRPPTATPIPPTDAPVLLNEAGWEKAAQGSDERIYPWRDTPLTADF